MKKVILDLAVTLDGFIEGPNGEIDWCIMDDDMNFDGFISSIDTIFYGRVSYDTWGNFQPDANASPTEQLIWKEVHSKNKFVFSSQSKQYGTGGHLHGKKFLICATWNAPEEAFSNPAQQLMQGKSTSDLLLNISSNYSFCGLEVIPGYNCFDIFKEGNIVKDLENYPDHLTEVFNV